jgi:hypothetical protein
MIGMRRIKRLLAALWKVMHVFVCEGIFLISGLILQHCFPCDAFAGETIVRGYAESHVWSKRDTLLPTSTTAGTTTTAKLSTINPRVWLTVEVLEKKPSLGSTASAFNEYIPVIIVDSATSAFFYALSGEMVQLAPERTYLVSVVSGDDNTFQIEGAPIHIVRTAGVEKEDVIHQHEFLIYSSPASDTASAVPEQLVADAPAKAKPVLKPEAATLSYQARSQCLYIVQFCAMSLENDAERISFMLHSASVADSRVEAFADSSRKITYHRVRAGCFTTITAAKGALEGYMKTIQPLKLGIIPVIVKLE